MRTRVVVRAGNGGLEALDTAGMIARMYQYCGHRRGWDVSCFTRGNRKHPGWNEYWNPPI